MFLRVDLRDGSNVVHEGVQDWTTTEEGELDIPFENGTTQKTYARGMWVSVELVLEDGEEPPEPQETDGETHINLGIGGYPGAV